MNEVEEKKVEVQHIDPLYFVVRELDSIKASNREEFDKVYKEFDKVYERLNRIEDQIHGLRSFTVKLVFSMAALIIAGVGILFQLMR